MNDVSFAGANLSIGAIFKEVKFDSEMQCKHAKFKGNESFG